MRLLIDTHIFIWLNEAPGKIPQQIMTLLSNPNHDLFLSLVSVWEMQIKIQLGKLQLQDPLPEILMTQQSVNKLQILPIQLHHIWALEGLPEHHRDPFDRLLIAQAIATQFSIVSPDSMFDQYSIQRLCKLSIKATSESRIHPQLPRSYVQTEQIASYLS